MSPTPLVHAAARALARHLPGEAVVGVEELAGWLEPPPDADLGDLALPCFRLAKALRKPPPVIAADLARALAEKPGGLIENAQPSGPYLNLKLAVAQAAELVLPGAAREPSTASVERAERVMVEYSQPNTHKAFHVGHMRNLCLGDALVRILRAVGHDVVAANYLGDVGAHIAKCLWWYLDRLDDEGRRPPPTHRGEWLGQLYTLASNQLEEWEEATKAGDAAAAAALQATRARTTEILRKLETRDLELGAVWAETRAWSLAEFDEIYAWSGVLFDRVFYESEVDDPGLRLVEEYLARGVFVESEGAIGIFNEEVKHMPFFMLRKRDGTSLYSTKDLALARLKFEEYRIDRSIYVVDSRQSDHFRHVFITLRKMGFSQAERCRHVPYEMVELPEGPMATRKGTVVLFRTLRETMTRYVIEHYLAKYRGDWPDAEIDEVARAVALGAIKYGMLGRDVNQKIVFDLEAWLDLEGNTGPYLQYAVARMRSIVRKCASEGKVLDPALLADQAPGRPEILAQLVTVEERELVLRLSRFAGIVADAAEDLRPSVLCTYLHELAKAYNRFNKACPVKPSEGALLQARLLAVHATERVMTRGLDLLGISAPERM